MASRPLRFVTISPRAMFWGKWHFTRGIVLTFAEDTGECRRCVTAYWEHTPGFLSAYWLPSKSTGAFTGGVLADRPNPLLPSQLGLEPVVGIEPTTYGLRNRCSTTELHWRPTSVAKLSTAREITQGNSPCLPGVQMRRIRRRRHARRFKALSQSPAPCSISARVRPPCTSVSSLIAARRS